MAWHVTTCIKRETAPATMLVVGSAHRLVTRPRVSHCTPVQLQGDAVPAVQPMKFWPAVADAQFVVAA